MKSIAGCKVALLDSMVGLSLILEYHDRAGGPGLLFSVSVRARRDPAEWPHTARLWDNQKLKCQPYIAIKSKWNLYHDWIRLWRLDSYFSIFSADERITCQSTLRSMHKTAKGIGKMFLFLWLAVKK